MTKRIGRYLLIPTSGVFIVVLYAFAFFDPGDMAEPGMAPIFVFFLFAAGGGILGFFCAGLLLILLLCEILIKRGYFELGPHLLAGLMFGAVSVAFFSPIGAFTKYANLLLFLAFAVGFSSFIAAWIWIIIPEQLRIEDNENSGSA